MKHLTSFLENRLLATLLLLGIILPALLVWYTERSFSRLEVPPEQVLGFAAPSSVLHQRSVDLGGVLVSEFFFEPSKVTIKAVRSSETQTNLPQKRSLPELVDAIREERIGEGNYDGPNQAQIRYLAALFDARRAKLREEFTVGEIPFSVFSTRPGRFVAIGQVEDLVALLTISSQELSSQDFIAAAEALLS